MKLAQTVFLKQLILLRIEFLRFFLRKQFLAQKSFWNLF